MAPATFFLHLVYLGTLLVADAGTPSPPPAAATAAKPGAARGSAAFAQPKTTASSPADAKPGTPPAPAKSAGAAKLAAASDAAAAASMNGPIENQHNHELEDIRRQDLAAMLATHQITVDWHEHKLAELVDWRDRVEVASILKTDQALDLDWHTMSLTELNDIRLRASKAGEILASYGVTVDWRLYSWRQLEEIRRAVARIQASESPTTAAGRRKGNPASHPKSGAAAVPGTRKSDRDAIFEL